MATEHHQEAYVTNTQAYRRTVSALFDKRADALKAVEELVRAGIPRTAVRVTPENDVTASGSTITAYDASRDEKGFWATLADFFMPDDDRYTYAEAINRGSILVTVTVDGTQADRAEEVLEQHQDRQLGGAGGMLAKGRLVRVRRRSQNNRSGHWRQCERCFHHPERKCRGAGAA